MSDSRRESLKEKILNTEDLPTLPITVSRILELVDNPKTTAGMLSELINIDPVLAAKVLKVANSAFFGFPRRISTLNLAIVILGFSSLKHLCLSVGIMNLWPENEKGSGLEMNAFWSHSIATGVAARLIAKKVKYEIPGEAFVCGLIHDIGKLLLNDLLNEEYKEILSSSQEGIRPLHAIEEDTLGVDHSLVGGWLTEKWNLPHELVQSIKAHHNINGQNDNLLDMIVYVADSLAHRYKVGNSGNFNPDKFEECLTNLCEKFGIDMAKIDMDEIMTEYEEELVNSKAFFNLNSTT
ncbi:MAG: HDOD domain-containing protein [Candidatus Marinimicrobia bacterium]|nr:HDOD domain-containing protein [Candidatus Neomarinimicrobiota bacterium]